MRRTRSLIVGLPLALIASAMTGPLMAAPPETGTVSVEPQGNAHHTALAAACAEAVAQALAKQGLTVIDGTGHGRYLAEVHLSGADVGTTSVAVRPDKMSAMPGGIVGVGGNVSVVLPTSKSKIVPLQQVRLEIRLKKRGESAVLWQARAVTVRAVENEAEIASDLVAAMFRTYPSQSEDVIGVP